jgi:phage gpG-like protein
MSLLIDMAARIESPAYLSGLASRVTSLVQKNMKEGAWEENAPLTIANKRGSKPLFDSNELATSLTSRVEGQKIICGTAKRYAQTVHDGGLIKAAEYKVPDYSGIMVGTLDRYWGSFSLCLYREP